MQLALTFNVKPQTSVSTAPEAIATAVADSAAESVDDSFAEWDTWETIHAVQHALETRYNVTLIEANLDAYSLLRDKKPNLVFNISEGFWGISREAQIPAVLDLLRIPYSGSDPLTLATCLDKARTKEILSFYGIPNAPFFVAFSPADLPGCNLGFPLIVKPIAEGSSKGIFSSSFVSNPAELQAETLRLLHLYQQPVLIEEFLPGREFTVAMLGNGPETRVLPIIEISYQDFPADFVPLYSYEAKWILDSKENQLDIYQCPAQISGTLRQQIEQICLKTYNILRCRDWSRIDIRIDKNGVPNVIEVNPLPGILPDPKENSCYPKAARTAGMDYNSMIVAVAESARKRYGLDE